MEAEEHIFISHAIYSVIKCTPPILNQKITRFIGVSDYACRQLEEEGKKLGREIHVERCYNPMKLPPKEKIIHLVSAARLSDSVRGGERTKKLIEALDKYCEKTGRHYIWHIFTKPVNWKINSPNVAIMPPRIDVRPYIADADFVVSIPDDMETFGYTNNEALSYSVPLVVTPLSILDEYHITDNEIIVLNYDCSNIDEVVNQIFNKEVKPFKYTPPEDDWNKFLAKGKNTYEEEKKRKTRVQCIKTFYDVERQKLVNPTDKTWLVSRERAEYLEDRKLVKLYKKGE